VDKMSVDKGNEEDECGCRRCVNVGNGYK